MKSISSRENALFKHIKALAHSSRERKKAGVVLIEGAHLIAAYLAAHGAPRTIVASASGQKHQEIAALISRCGDAEQALFDDALFNEASSLETPAGVLALIEAPLAQPVSADVSACLLLEDIQDPGNVGSILRSAAAAGVRHVLLSKGCAFAWAPKVLRAAQGAHFLLNIVEDADLVAFARAFAGQTLALTPRATKTIYDVDLKQAVALMLGNEGAGLSADLVDAARQKMTIPMPGKTESLNAAAAAAVCLFEMVRQRR